MSQVSPRTRLLRRPAGIAAVALAISVLAALTAPAGCGVDNEVVGGACATGFTQCGLTCVDTTDDPNDCGGCGIVCPGGVCRDSKCVGEGDSGHKDGASDAKPKQDGPRTDAPKGDGPLTDGPRQDGQGQDGPSLDGPTSDGPKSDGPAKDVVVTDAFEEGCTPPEVECSGMCVDESDDPDNCGKCGKICPSGICYMGVCEGSSEGDIVVIGHDYHSTSSTVSAGKLVSNAVFLAETAKVRILSFEHYADATSVSNVKSILNAEATVLGRTLAFTVSTTDTDIPTDLTTTSYDVLIVYDQESAAPGVLGPLGTSWASTLSAFTIGGGVVVSLDGAAGTTEEMPAFDTNAGLLAVSAHTVIPKGTALDVIAPGDVVGHGVVSPYAAEPDSVYFTTSTLGGGDVTYVVVDPLDAGQVPVVVHIDVP
jgi:hypothetical protein